MRKLLVANRGEIAVRIIRAAREMGIATVAVYSDADVHAVHATLADEAVNIGEPEAARSYLDASAILDAARKTGADAIHPGYGFLSERADFAEAVERAGLNFVGPPSGAMRALGDKISAKRLAEEAGVPVTPGHYVPGASDTELKAAAERIGFPVMLKASAGGGGRGMRAVHEASRFDDELRTATDEALKAFGDGSMMVEKLVPQPRHVEVQVLADSKGNVAPLFERECSLQRRHQKLVEEAPSPAMSEGLWARMRDAASALCRAAGYRNAGTVEFMLDQAAEEFFFLEVNARLQVEHPVTEAIAGIDLAQWQLRIADGETLPQSLLDGDRRGIQGHAIEARIVAEDPEKGFLPSSGKIIGWAEPRMPGIRVDTGYGPGCEISRYYDSLVAKVVAHAATRSECIRRLADALRDFHVLGVRTNIAFLLDVLGSSSFVSGNYHTATLAKEFGEWSDSLGTPHELAYLVGKASSAREPSDSIRPRERTTWAQGDGFRNVRREGS